MLKKILISKKEYIILFFVTILICLPFITSSQYVHGDDTHYHVSNIYARYTRMCEGGTGLEKVLPIVGNDFGYGSGIFYPGLPHIVSAGLTYVLQGNVILALKIIHFIVYYISAIMMFKLVKRVFKSKYVALIAGVFYITFPYAITDVFTRDALAESFIFMFIPMAVLGLYELFEGNKRWFYIWFITGYVGMINTHLVMSVYFTMFVVIYLLVNIKKVFKINMFRSLVSASIMILLLTLPFTISLLEHNFIGEYYVFEGETMASKDIIEISTMFPWELLIQKSMERFSNVRLYLNLLAVVLTIFTIIKRKSIIKNDAEKRFYRFLWIFAALAIFMLTVCPWKILPDFMIMIQFAWRLQTMLVFALSVLAALALRKTNTRKAKTICLAIIVIYNMVTVSYTYLPDRFVEYNLDDVDMSYYGMGWEKEYLPLRTTKNMDYFWNRGNDVLVRRGRADIEKTYESTPELDFKVTNNTGDAIVVELPRIYYLGYTITFINENNEVQELHGYMNENGFIDVRVIGNGTVQVRYNGTTFQNTANKVAGVTALLIIAYIIFDRVKYIIFRNKHIGKIKLLPEGKQL